MPIRQGLVTEIGNALGGTISPGIASHSAACDIYEAYIWSLVVSAARREGASVQFEDVTGSKVSSLRFRTSPGTIYSTIPYTYASLNFQGCPTLEVHQGIYVSGKSRVAHEADVAVVYGDEAQTCRQNQVHPRCSRVVLAVECKFYSTNLGLDLARSFLGLTDEIMKDYRTFVSNTSSPTVVKLLTSHKRCWETGVSPLNPRLRDRLRSYFETCFRDFQARN